MNIRPKICCKTSLVNVAIYKHDIHHWAVMTSALQSYKTNRTLRFCTIKLMFYKSEHCPFYIWQHTWDQYLTCLASWVADNRDGCSFLPSCLRACDTLLFGAGAPRRNPASSLRAAGKSSSGLSTLMSRNNNDVRGVLLYNCRPNQSLCCNPYFVKLFGKTYF